MTFLKKIGQILLKAVEVVTGYLPLIGRAVPGIGHDLDRLSKIITMVVTAEQMFANAFGPDQKTGAQKLEALRPFVSQLLADLELVKVHGIKDRILFNKAVEGYINSTVDLLNSLGA